MGGMISELTVCVSAAEAAYVAPFALFSNVAGAPGEEIDSFDVSIPEDEDRGFASAPSEVGALLRPGSSYWIVALRSETKGTWWRTFPVQSVQQATLRADETEWEISERAILQMRVRAVPEPQSGPIGAALVLVVVKLCRARRRASQSPLH
jgi:hypothetical protein